MTSFLSTPLGIFIFQYLVLGLIFLIGLIYTIRQGDVGWARGEKRRNLVMLVGGFALYAAIHGFFQFVAVDL
jgi:hypothetical protein